jgi:hypothetical protein
MQLIHVSIPTKSDILKHHMHGDQVRCAGAFLYRLCPINYGLIISSQPKRQVSVSSDPLPSPYF